VIYFSYSRKHSLLRLHNKALAASGRAQGR
jgi:hypothetical protein